MSGTERVEFVDAQVSGGHGDDLVESGDDGGRPPGRWGLLVVALVVLALVAAGLVAKVSGGSTPQASTPSPSSSGVGRSAAPPVTTPIFGLVGLPPGIGEPRQLVAAQSGDVVWMLDRGAGIVRIDGGVETAAQLLERQATAIAVSPSGNLLYVATAGEQPMIQVLNATTLALGRSRPLEGNVSALTVSTDAVWAAVGSHMLRLDIDSLLTLDTLDLPDVVLTDHLRMQSDQSLGNQQFVVGLVTGGNDDGSTTSRLVRINPLTSEVLFGPPIPGVVDVATTHYLTWVTAAPSPTAALTTEGYESVLDPTPRAVATPALPAGTRIYDGGGGDASFLSVAPHSSLVDCHDDGGFAKSEFDVRPALPQAVVTGQVLRTDTAFYVVTDRGLVRSGVGGCT